MEAAEKVMKKGGEVNFKVIARDNRRIPEIRVYPENYTLCKIETLII